VTDSFADQAPGTDPAGPTDPADWLTLPDVAERLDVSISKVHQMIRDRELLAVRRDGVRRIPADLVANQTVLKHLPGVLNLLTDNGYDDEAALRWLYEPDDILPGGTPATALSGSTLPSPTHCARSCARTRMSSWWARSAMWIPCASPCSRP
jgi:hypothetical protein